jgi:hypothetical protein
MAFYPKDEMDSSHQKSSLKTIGCLPLHAIQLSPGMAHFMNSSNSGTVKAVSP